MKVDTTKLKKGSSELTPECRQLIEQITKCRSRNEILDFLSTIQVWIYGKCELYHWVEILDRFDKVLEEAARFVNGNEFMLHCDTTFSAEDIRLLLLVLNFTTLLIEHSFSRHLYNSVEHLTKLLSSQNMDIVLAVLNLLYMFSKRSNFIPRLSFEKKEMLLIKLFNIAERWGDPNYGLSLIDCCIKKPKLEFLYQLYIEYVDENGLQALLEIPDMMDICLKTPPCEVIKSICRQISNPTETIKMRIAHRVRLVSGFKNYKLRLQFVQARLQAVSVLIYSNALLENIDRVLYTGFGEELCELIDKEDVDLVEIRAAVLRTLTSMLHFDRNPNVARPGSRLSKIIQYTGADRQGGILPLLVRDCIASLTGDSPSDKYPLVLATSLFSLLYHLASYEAGGQALVKSGMMQSLLRVISWPGVDLEHITFVTRAVRVIDLITNIDIAKFHQHNGLNIFIDRLEKEVKKCRSALGKEKNIYNKSDSNAESPTKSELQSDATPFDVMSEDVLSSTYNRTNLQINEESESSNSNTYCEMSSGSLNLEANDNNVVQGPQQEVAIYPPNSYYARPVNERMSDLFTSSTIVQQRKLACVTQRAALLKSMLNFLKKSIQDHAHFNGMRNIMETSLPSSLRHIISNADYYGPSLFLLATDVVTVYVFNEPSLLSSLQDLGITNVMLQSLLQKDVPATREVLGSLPNVFSALCLNERGLMEFMSYEPFDKLLKVLLSPDYLVAMRRRRSSDPLGDTATNLGNAMDDLMKHHPYLRTDATEAIVRLLNELVRLGTHHNFICWRANKESNSLNNVNASNNGNNYHQDMMNTTSTPENENNENTNDSSGEDDDEDDEMSTASQQQQRQSRSIAAQPHSTSQTNIQEREAIPLIDYILNVMKFIEAIFNNSSNGSNEHCREFVLHGGLNPLLQLLSLPNLPVDSPVSTTAQAVANVCKSILNLAHETKVIDIALQQLSQIVKKLKPLIQHCSLPGGSILLREFLSCPKLEDGFSNADYTPLLHYMSSVHGYVIMLVHLCRNATNEMRIVLLKRWGTNMENGLDLLQNLVQLYISLVWESTILLNLCSEEQSTEQLWEESGSMESFANKDVQDQIGKSTEAEKKNVKPKLKSEEHLRYIKSLLAASSRLGRALAELFGTLVKLAVGTPPSRQRRNNDFVTSVSSSKIPTPDAREIARVLSSILVNGFNHENMLTKPAPKLKLTFLICSVGFTGPMLFDDKRSSFHLMISQFCEEHGLKAFFDMFFWALSLNNLPAKSSFEKCMTLENVLEDSEDDYHNFPEGTGEFLDAWLQLLEKMVNPRAILDSPYSISSRILVNHYTINFEPVFYLIQVHQTALQSIRRIWKRKPIANYGVSMTESIMAILKHLIKSHSMLIERYQARINELKATSQLVDQTLRPAQTTSTECNVNPEYLKILTDMGFIRTHVVEALLNTRSLEQATEYLLNHPEATTNATQSMESALTHADATTSQESSNEMDVDLFATSEEANIVDKKVDKCSAESKSKICYEEVRLISNEIFNKFCDETLEQTFMLMEHLPETINTGAELISVLYRRHNQASKFQFVNNLVKNITDLLENILQTININNTFVVDDNEELISGAVSTKLFIRLKVSTLLLDETYMDIRKELCDTFTREKSLGSFLSLLNISEQLLYKQLLNGVKPITPRWLQTLIEFIDAIDNVSVILQRKINMRAVCSENWKWYDSSTGKWNPYSESHNLLLKNAFNMGERSVVINNGRQRYNINFNCMTQVNEASGSHRTVLPSLKIMDAMGMLSGGNPKIKISQFVTRTLKSKPDKNGYEYEDKVLSLSSLMNFTDETVEDTSTFDTYDTKGISRKLNAEEEETQADVIEIALPSNDLGNNNDKKNSSSQVKRVQKIILNEEAVGLAKFDTTIIIACLVRMLEPNLLLAYETKLTILKLCARLTRDYKNAKIFYKCGGLNILLNMHQTCGLMGFPTYAIVIIRHLFEAPTVLQESIERILTVRTSQLVPVGHRDVTFVLMQMSSAVARHPKIFLEAAKQVLKADHMMRPSFTNDDCRLLIKSQPSPTRKGLNASPLNKSIDTEPLQTAVGVVKELLLAIVRPCVHYGGVAKEYQSDKFQDSAENELFIENTQTSSTSTKKQTEKFEPCCCSWHIPSNGHIHQKPVLPRSTILKILADAVRSYQSLIPQILIEHVYTPEHSVLIKKEQSFLGFILDNFLPIVRKQQDPEVSMMARVLVASLSDCFAQSSIQTKVVEEIQDAIVRALAQPDSAEKQTRLQVLIGLLPTMIESPMLTNKIHIQRNNMYRVLLRQGIMSYLSKLAQYKDISNYNSINTVYAILRPMEILLRLTVTPGAISSKRIFYGPGPQSSVNRRLYPRLLSRSSVAVPNSIGGGEHVLRDIIRNVLSDRRHAFDFVFNTDDVFESGEEATGTSRSADEEPNDNEDVGNVIENMPNSRPQLNFERLWDDLLQNEGLRLVNRNTNLNNAGANSIETGERQTSNDDTSGNDNVVSGGSDGASTSSETAPTAQENPTSLLGDVSTSDSESDSNVSTENEDRNEEDDDENDEDPNEDVEDRSETDGDEETRQFIEVFDHIYEPESSETASNDADVDADDEGSEVDVNNSLRNVAVSNSDTGAEASSSGTHLTSQEEEREEDISNINERTNLSNVTASSFNSTYNVILHNLTNETTPSSSFGSVRSTPGTQWVTPRLTFMGGNGAFNSSMDIETANTNTNLNGDRDIHTGQGPQTTITSATHQIGSPGQRRENSRRLVFLDQQYCAPMPSCTNPTEEGQIELFNQDALHWWFEEAKHLDLESQTDACLNVAHRLVPFLIKELKENFIKDLKSKKADSSTSLCSNNSGNSRRSAIPVLIQQSNSSAQNLVNMDRTTIPSTEPDIETSTPQEQEVTTSVSTTSLEEQSESQQHANIEQIWSEGRSSNYVDQQSNNAVLDQNSIHLMNEDEVNASLNVSLSDRESVDNLLSNRQHSEISQINDEAILIDSADTRSVNTQQVVQNIDENCSNSAEIVEHIGTTLAREGGVIGQNAINSVSQLNAPIITESEIIPNTVATNLPEMSPEVRAALGDLEIPEGVDPSFLAALPSEMREEVIQEHLRMQRLRQRAQQNANQVSHDAVLEVNPEFLAALPPNIQSEVLLQQRIEQQRQAAQSANPEDPVDTAAFFQNLPESLRQAILTDMEDSQIASLPPDLAAEAQYLRRDWESRNGARLGGFRFPSSLQNLSDESRWNSNSIWYDATGTPQSQHHQHTTILHHHQQQHGKPIALLLMEDENNLLDPDSLSTLLLFLFIEDPKLNYSRLHRVIRNLCYHLPTREWVINALISIIQKTNERKFNCTLRKGAKPQWLKLHVDAAFGYKSNVFIINKLKDLSGSTSAEYIISINPQAAQMVVRNCLDMLFVLAKHFAKSFLPFNKERDQKSRIKQTDGTLPVVSPNETIESIPLALTIGNTSSQVADAEVSSDELRALFYRHQPSSVNLNSRRSVIQYDVPKGNEVKLDETPSTSKAALRNQCKISTPTQKNKNNKIQYNTNAENFWDVILNIDRSTQTRISNIQSFPLKCNPIWEWKSNNLDFLTFNDSPFALLLEMLPYKVICRSPHLTDMLVKLLASLSTELPKEDESFELASNDTQSVNKTGVQINEQKPSIDGKTDEQNNSENPLQQESCKLKRRMYSKNFSQLQLVIEVLTHQCGTTEGLENISKLIVNLSQCSQASNAIFMQYLSAAINGLAQEVRTSIQSLLNEIRCYNAGQKPNNITTTKQTSNAACVSFCHQFVMQDRFTAENVVISAPTNIKPTCELQLPTMKKLLSPSSAQPYFLRTLKIFIQVRELFESQNNEPTTDKLTLSQIICLDDLWNTLSECLTALEESKDEYAVLVLQPTVEAFFLIHASKMKKLNKTEGGIRNSTYSFENNLNLSHNVNLTNSGTNNIQSQKSNITTDSIDAVQESVDIEKSSLNNQLQLDRQKFLHFAEKHRTVLNQILRQSSIHLADGPFAVLVDHTRILDFDVKRKYFQTELERIDEGVRREENTVGVRRVTVFEDSFRVLYRLGPEEWKNRFYIVFEDEEGQDAGGLLREWYVIISREIFNPMYALFCVSPGDRVTYMINPSSHANPNHLSYFKFVGRVIAKAIHDNKLLECYFTRSFYKHILGKQVKYTDMESQDYEFYKGLDYLMKNDISTLGYELTFSTEIQEFGVTQVRDLIPNGRNITVTEDNKFEYVNLVCQLKMSGSIRQQLDAFLEGFYDIIPKHLISIFNEQELELLISGLPDIDIEDLKANTEYHKYNSKSIQIQWFWRALRSFDQADRAKFLQFVTGTSKVPLQGFGSLEGMNGIQKFQIHRDDRSTDRLPCAHTCFNQLDLPMYKSYEKLRCCLLKAIHECSEGFGFA